MLKLRLTVQDSDDGPPDYIALSHCWGSDPAFKLTTQNLPLLIEDIPFGALPKSYQDAVTVSGWLEGKYFILISA